MRRIMYTIGIKGDGVQQDYHYLTSKTAHDRLMTTLLALDQLPYVVGLKKTALQSSFRDIHGLIKRKECTGREFKEELTILTRIGKPITVTFSKQKRDISDEQIRQLRIIVNYLKR